MKGGLRGIIFLLIVIVSIVIGYSFASQLNGLDSSVTNFIENSIGDGNAYNVYNYTNYYWWGLKNDPPFAGYEHLMTLEEKNVYVIHNISGENIYGDLSINTPILITSNITINSTGMYWLQGLTCKMRQYHNGTHWVTTGAC